MLISKNILREIIYKPLFESFTSHTPYHYAFNSPVQWKDPSGLYPEDEKGEKVQSMLDLFDVGYFEDIADLGFSENRDYDEHWALGYDFYLSHDSPIALFNEFMQGHYEAFGSGGGGRTSGDGAEGGIPSNIKFNFQGDATKQAEKQEQFFAIISKSEDLQNDWNAIKQYYTDNPNYSLTITDNTSDFGQAGSQGKNAILSFSSNFFDRASDDRTLPASISHLSHEFAHISGRFSGERISKNVMFTMSNGNTIPAEELRSQQIANKTVNNWAISNGKLNYFNNWDGWHYKGASGTIIIPKDIRFPGSVDFSRMRKDSYKIIRRK